MLSLKLWQMWIPEFHRCRKTHWILVSLFWIPILSVILITKSHCSFVYSHWCIWMVTDLQANLIVFFNTNKYIKTCTHIILLLLHSSISLSSVWFYQFNFLTKVIYLFRFLWSFLTTFSALSITIYKV